MKLINKEPNPGFTLVEVVIAMALVALVAAATLMAMTRGSALCYSTAQHYAGYSLCRETIEQMRGANYGMIATNNFPSTNMLLTHLGGTARIPITCTRFITNQIVELSNPTRKQVSVAASWTYCGSTQIEIMTGFIYLK